MATIDRAVERFNARVEAGEFEFDEARARKLLDPAQFAPGPNGEPPSPSGEAQAAGLKLAAIIFETDEGTALGMLAEKPAEVKLVMQLVFAQSFSRPKAEGEARTPEPPLPPSTTSSPA